jgi:DNA-binding CsgD family transcriptional regulator
MLAVVSLVRGEREQAGAWLERAEASVQDLASPQPRAYLQFVRGAQAYQRGDYSEAEARLRETISVLRETGPGGLLWHLGWLGLALAAQGKDAEAGTCLAELDGLLEGLPVDSVPAGYLLTLGAQVALAIADQNWLARRHAQLAAFRGRWFDALVDRVLGELYVSREEWEAAREVLQAAEATARRQRLHWDLPRVLEARAELELAAPSPGAGVRPEELLGEALASHRLTGDAAGERRVGERLRILAPGRGEGPAPPSGLTTREAEVLRLVAAGESNRAIAKALFLSESTVAHHLTSIYGKTGTDNRAAAAAFAIRHGLA